MVSVTLDVIPQRPHTSGIMLRASISAVIRPSASWPMSGLSSRTTAPKVALCFRHTDRSAAPRSVTSLEDKLRPTWNQFEVGRGEYDGGRPYPLQTTPRAPLPPPGIRLISIPLVSFLSYEILLIVNPKRSFGQDATLLIANSTSLHTIALYR